MYILVDENGTEHVVHAGPISAFEEMLAFDEIPINNKKILINKPEIFVKTLAELIDALDCSGNSGDFIILYPFVRDDLVEDLVDYLHIMLRYNIKIGDDGVELITTTVGILKKYSHDIPRRQNAGWIFNWINTRY